MTFFQCEFIIYITKNINHAIKNQVFLASIA